MTETVPCPICASDKAEAVRKAADIVTCSKCGVTYLRTRPTVEELEKLYQSYASNPGSHMKLPTTIDQIRTTGLRRDTFLNQVLECVSPGGWMLDVGSGWGAFLHNARTRGFSVAGVEICKPMADFATNMLGIPTTPKQLEQSELPKSTFSVVTMLHSLEHLPSTRSALGYVHGILKDDGYLCGIVPNFGSFASRTMTDKWPWLDPHMHYTHFTPETLKKVLWLHGFNVIRIYTTTGDFDRQILASAIQSQEPKLHGDRLVDRIIELEGQNVGEELRFFAQRI